MKMLIGNELNTKAIINNIRNNVMPNLTILTGVFGTGKTEFAKDIARMITCLNLTDKGYCGKCEACLTPITETANAFNAQIQLLNMDVISYEQMQTLVKQATLKERDRPEVFIFDEIHLFDKKDQELWLAETSKLTNCYIIMTTTEKKGVSQGLLSRSVQLQMRSLTPLQAKSLVLENFRIADDKTISTIVRRAGGSPRELINLAKFCAGSGLTAEEAVLMLTGTDTSQVIHAMECLYNREEFFKAMRSVRMLPEFSVKQAMQDVLWTYLASNPAERMSFDYLKPFSEKQIIEFLNLNNSSPYLTLLRMFQQITVKPRKPDTPMGTQLPPEPTTKNVEGKKGEQLERW